MTDKTPDGIEAKDDATLPPGVLRIEDPELNAKLWQVAVENGGKCCKCGEVAFVLIEPEFDPNKDVWNCRDVSAQYGSDFDDMYFIWTRGMPAWLKRGDWLCDKELAALIDSGAVEEARPIFNETLRGGSVKLPQSDGDGDYQSEHLGVFEEMEPIRKRPAGFVTDVTDEG